VCCSSCWQCWDDDEPAVTNQEDETGITAKEGAGGWGDDDLDHLDVENDAAPAPPPVPASAPVRMNSAISSEDDFQDAMEDNEGWGDDEDIFVDDGGDQPAVLQTPARDPPPSKTTHHHKLEEVHQELVSYVESLMVVLPSVNAVLEAEYNHPGKAQELLQYYTERPQLRAYTIDKELPRMEYRLVLEHEHADEPIVVENKQEIAQMFKLQPELDLLARCSNQSLLADLLQVMTGSDCMVRPQYMATCMAQSCLFVLRPRPGTDGGLVECNCQLVLSLPGDISSGERHPVANIQALIAFGIPPTPQDPPMIYFKIQTMDIVLPNMDILRSTAQFLLESGLIDHPPMSPFPESPAGGPAVCANGGDFRDVFLQQSQTMLQNSTVGLKSAWKQIDSVAGLQNKMNLVKKIIPSGDSSVIEAAMKEQEEYHLQLQEQRKHDKQQQQQQATIHAADTVPVSYPPTEGGPPPHHQHQVPPQAAAQRPTSILGSFMGRLAKTVTLPEEDPRMYEEYAAEMQRKTPLDFSGGPQPQAIAGIQHGPQPSPVHFYRKDDDGGALPRTTPQAPSAEQNPATKTSPWLSRLTEPAPVPAPSPAPVPQPLQLVPPQQPKPDTMDDNDHEEELGVGDGWDDDDLVLDDGAEEIVEEKIEDVKLTEAQPPSRAFPVPQTTSSVEAGDKSPPPALKQKSSAAATIATTGAAPNEPASAELKQTKPEDDIVETRKRYVNPRPGLRQLRPLLS
jgi:hypothetical protein